MTKLSFSLLLALLAKRNSCELAPKLARLVKNTCSAVNGWSLILKNNTCFTLPDVHQPELTINGAGVLEFRLEWDETTAAGPTIQRSSFSSREIVQ